MSKKPIPDMDDLMALKSRKATQKATESSTDDTQAPHKHSTGNTLKRYDVRFNPDDWEWLKQHFEAKGLTVSAGLRMIVKEYLTKEER
jgi:hypothetical protein